MGSEGSVDEALSLDGRPAPYARFPPPAELEDLRMLFWPLDPRTFYDSYYAQRVLHAEPSSPRGFLVHRVYGPPNEEHNVEGFLHSLHLLHVFRAGAVEGRRRGKLAPTPNTYSALRDALDAGESFVAHVPSAADLDAGTAGGRRAPLLRFGAIARMRHRLEAALRMPVSANLYVSGMRSVALAPHTDTWDTVIVHLEGRKHWRVCVPVTSAQVDAALSANGWPRAALSEADRSELREAEAASEAGCTAHTDAALADSKQFECTEYTLTPGALLWLPKGVVHAAQESESEQGLSVHLTLGLRREGLRFVDFLKDALTDPALLENVAAAMGRLGGCGSGSGGSGLGWGGNAPAEPGSAATALLRDALADVSSGVEGICFRRPFPTWLFACPPSGGDVSSRWDGSHILLCAPVADSQRWLELSRAFEWFALRVRAAAVRRLLFPGGQCEAEGQGEAAFPSGERLPSPQFLAAALPPSTGEAVLFPALLAPAVLRHAFEHALGLSAERLHVLLSPPMVDDSSFGLPANLGGLLVGGSASLSAGFARHPAWALAGALGSAALTLSLLCVCERLSRQLRAALRGPQGHRRHAAS